MKDNVVLIIKPQDNRICYTTSVGELIDNNWRLTEQYFSIADFLNTDEIKNIYYTNIIALPSDAHIQALSNSDCIVTTKGQKSLIQKLSQLSSEQIIEIDEQINGNGIIQQALSEPEINKILRQVFQMHSKYTALVFMNSILNPLHQNNLKNVLFTARIKSIIPEF